MYHSIGMAARGSICADAFSDHLRTITLQCPSYVFLDWRKGFESLQGCPGILVTFDDGYQDNYRIALGALKQWGVKAIFFITTGFVERELDITKGFYNYRGLTPMTWKEIEMLISEGHTVGLHGHTHPNFNILSFADAANEMERSIGLFESRIGIRPSVFAYPYGQYQHQRHNFNEYLRSREIKAVFTTENRRADISGAISSSVGVPHIPRIRIDRDDDVKVLCEKISGQWDYVYYLQRLRAAWSLRSIKPLLQR